VYGHVSLIEFLHGHGADVTMVDQYDATPLHYAVQMCVQQQQQPQQAQRDEEGKEAEDGIHRATHIKLLRAVLARTEMVNLFDQQHRTPLIWAASCGNLHIVFIVIL